MHAAVVHAFNAPPRYATFADPVPEAGEVLVTMRAAGLHQIVRALASGAHYIGTGVLPFIPRVDGVGTLADGTRVYCMGPRSPFGSFAGQTVVQRTMCLPLPDGVDDVTAAGLANPAMSSWAALKLRAGFTAGESVLILGATGTSGQLAVQIAKRLGARRVIAAGRDSQALEKLRAMGADSVVSLRQERAELVAAFRREWAKAGVDVVLDYLWGEPAEILLDAISQKGLPHAARLRFIQIGSMAGTAITLQASTLRSSRVELLGSGFGGASMEQLLKSIAEFFAEAARQPFQVNTETVALRDVETLWGRKDSGTRLVFQP